MTAWPLQFAVYGAGDAGAGGNFPALQPFLWRQLTALSAVISNAEIAGIVQLDNMAGPAVRWVLDPLRRQAPSTIAEVDTGDPRELIAFCSWCESLCPAERHVLVLSGHGLAFQDNVTQQYYGRGAVGDGGDVIRRAKSLFVSATVGTRALLMDQSDFLTVPELRFALREIAQSCANGLIDVVVFDACLMSNIETLNELAGVAGAAVGSVDEISGAGMNLAGAASALSASPSLASLGATQIAQAFVDAYTPDTPSDSCIAIALDRQHLDAGVQAFAQFAASLLTEIQASADLARQCRDALAVSSRTMVRYKSKSLADLAAVNASLKTIGLSAATQAALDQAMRAFTALVIDRRVGDDYANALGISLFAPSGPEQFDINAGDYRQLSFAVQTKWIDVLSYLYRQPAI